MNFKKITALALAVVLTLSVTGCNNGKDMSWAAKLDDTTISAGVYVLNVISGINAAAMQADPAVEDFMTADIGGKTGAQIANEFALEETKRQLAIHKKFVDLGLTMTAEETKNSDDYAKQMYEGDPDMYKANGVSEQTFIDYNRYAFEQYKVFQAIYGPDGEKAGTKEEMSKSFSDSYNIAYIIPYLKVDQVTGVPLEGEALAKMIADSDAAYKSVQEGKNVADVVYEVSTEQMGEGATPPERGEDTDYLMVVEKENTGTFPPLVYDHLATAANDSIALIEDETFRLIIKKVDETKAPEKLSEYYYIQMLPQIKQEEFQALALEWANAAAIELNQPAINHYTGEKIKKETDAYLKAQSSSDVAAQLPSSLPATESTPGNEPAPEAPATPESSSSSTAG